MIGDAIFRQGETSPAGSGNIQSFVRMSNPLTEQGYNTDARGGSGSTPYLDPAQIGTDSTATFDHALPLNTVPIVSINGQLYLEFVLDINQINKDGENLLSLDQVQISLASSPTLGDSSSTFYTTNGTYGGNAQLIYSTDTNSWVKLDGNLAPGSGGADMFLDIPLSALPDSAFSGANRTLPLASNQYIYLFSSFGNHSFTANGETGGAANDGFEEWATPHTRRSRFQYHDHDLPGRDRHHPAPRPRHSAGRLDRA